VGAAELTCAWRAGVAKALAKLHEAGYVFHNMKPSDVAWDADAESWQLLDFSRCVPSGTRMPLMHYKWCKQ
jgi:hypothetical protein